MKVLIINMVIVFFIKVIDNLLSTGKVILVQKNKAILASLCVVITNIIFYELIDVVNNSGDIAIAVISIGSGVGTLLALVISDKFSKDRTYVNIILNDDKKIMKDFRQFLMEHKITNLTTDGYTKDFKKTLAITAYAETKEQSRLIDEYIKHSETKFKRIIQVK